MTAQHAILGISRLASMTDDLFITREIRLNGFSDALRPDTEEHQISLRRCRAKGN
jgi:hypothetical protein